MKIVLSAVFSKVFFYNLIYLLIEILKSVKSQLLTWKQGFCSISYEILIILICHSDFCNFDYKVELLNSKWDLRKGSFWCALLMVLFGHAVTRLSYLYLYPFEFTGLVPALFKVRFFQLWISLQNHFSFYRYFFPRYTFHR